MRIEPVFEGELTIGKFYQVPTVFGLFGYRYDFWPVLGPAHDDKEIIGFEYVHYHYDFRFFNSRQWAFALDYTMDRPHSMVMSYNPRLPETKLGPVVFKRRKYFRASPQWPYPKKSGWPFDLAMAYKDAHLKDMICPHRGASLRGMPVDEAGCVTCPLHGLRWDVETGGLAVTK